MIDLQTFIKAKKLTQKELAAFLGFSQAFVSEIMSGKKQLPDTAYQKLYEKYGEELTQYKKSKTAEPETLDDQYVSKTDYDKLKTEYDKLNKQIIELQGRIIKMQDEEKDKIIKTLVEFTDCLKKNPESVGNFQKEHR